MVHFLIQWMNKLFELCARIYRRMCVCAWIQHKIQSQKICNGKFKPKIKTYRQYKILFAILLVNTISYSPQTFTVYPKIICLSTPIHHNICNIFPSHHCTSHTPRNYQCFLTMIRHKNSIHICLAIHYIPRSPLQLNVWQYCVSTCVLNKPHRRCVSNANFFCIWFEFVGWFVMFLEK